MALRTGLWLRARRAAASRALLIEAGVLSLRGGSWTVLSEALLTARAVGAGIATRAVVAEGTVAGASVSLRLAIAARGIALRLTAQILWPVLGLIQVSACPVLRLVEISGAWLLLAELSRLLARLAAEILLPILSGKIIGVGVPVLLLIAALIEVWGLRGTGTAVAEVVRPIVWVLVRAIIHIGAVVVRIRAVVVVVHAIVVVAIVVVVAAIGEGV